MFRPLFATALAAGLLLATAGAQAQNKLKVGFMLPYTGTYAALGTAIENGFRLYVQEGGGKIGGREIEMGPASGGHAGPRRSRTGHSISCSRGGPG